MRSRRLRSGRMATTPPRCCWTRSRRASFLDGDTLVVDRQGIRDHLNSVTGYSGLIGTINCDEFGDCGAARITVVQNIGGEDNVEASMENVMFSFAP